MSDTPSPGKSGSLDPWAYGLFLALLLGLFAAEVFSNYQPVKLSALLIAAFWVPLLGLHEAGHAVVAWLLGWRVGQVVIGMGPPISRFRVGGTPVEVRLAPVEGFVVPIPRDLQAIRLKSALIYFAGPGVELLVLIGVVLLVGPDRLLTRTQDIGPIIWQSLCVAILVSVVLNLVPHWAVQPDGRVVANDGLGIIRSFLLPEAHYQAMLQLPAELDEGDEEWDR
jgi:hypothetical protein